MTIEEAISWQDAFVLTYCKEPKVVTATEIAKQSMEKQIPKKPHKHFEKFNGIWCCCGAYLGEVYSIDSPNYCNDCGQKIDWSDYNG